MPERTRRVSRAYRFKPETIDKIEALATAEGQSQTAIVETAVGNLYRSWERRPKQMSKGQQAGSPKR